MIKEACGPAISTLVSRNLLFLLDYLDSCKIHYFSANRLADSQTSWIYSERTQFGFN